jgi:putative ABC transport system substrate-binding protein
MNKKTNKRLITISSIIAFLLILGIFLRSKNDKQHLNKKVVNIGILQFVEHEALDLARQGFIDELSNLGFKDGENIKIDYKNSQGDASTCNLIANQFVSDNKDMILAIATPAALSAAKATKNIPILVTPITNPEDAKLVKSNEKPDTNVTGTSDLAPVAKQIGLIKDLLPHAKNVGILYSSGEPNSLYQAKLAEEECKKLGLTSKVYTFSQANELQSVMDSMKGAIDALYTPTDNTVASNLSLITKVATQHKIPVVSSDKSCIMKGSAFGYCIDYYDIGKLTGTKASQVLNGEKPQDIPIKYLTENKLLFNQKAVQNLKITVPENLLKISEFVDVEDFSE